MCVAPRQNKSLWLTSKSKLSNNTAKAGGSREIERKMGCCSCVQNSGCAPENIKHTGRQMAAGWFFSPSTCRAPARRLSLSPVCFFPATSCRQLSSVPNIYKQPERRERRHRQSRQAGPIRPKKATDPPLAPLPIIHILFLSHPRDHIRPRHTCQKWHLPLASLVHT